MIWVSSGPHQPRASSMVSSNPFLEPDSSSTCHNTIPLALKSEGNRPPEFCKKLQEKPYVPWGEVSPSLGRDIHGTILDLLGRNNTPWTSTSTNPTTHPSILLSLYHPIHPFSHPFVLLLIDFHTSYSFSFKHHPICVSILYFIHSPIILYTHLSIHLTTHLSYHLSIIFSSTHPSILQPFT